MQALIVTTFGGLACSSGIAARRRGGRAPSGSPRSSPTRRPGAAGDRRGRAPAGRRAHQVGAGPVPLLAARGAMAAPTPVSAYLHAAAMVKAGVYLVALLAPAFAGVPGWRAVLLVARPARPCCSAAGGRCASTTSSCCSPTAPSASSASSSLVVGVGTRSAALAGLALLLAHALFKATLFLVVGIVDHSTGTRDLRELSGVGRRLPVLAVAATLAGASMAGLPPLLGFVAKESVLARCSTSPATATAPGSAGGRLAGSCSSGWSLGSVAHRRLHGPLPVGRLRRPSRDVPATACRSRPAAGVRRRARRCSPRSRWCSASSAPRAPSLLDAVRRPVPAPGAHERRARAVARPRAAAACSRRVTLGARRRAVRRARRPCARLQAALVRAVERRARLPRRDARCSTGRRSRSPAVTQRGSLAVYLAVILVVVVLLPGLGTARAAGGAVRAGPAGTTPAQARRRRGHRRRGGADRPAPGAGSRR